MTRTTTRTGTAIRPILAPDLGKYKSVACTYDTATAQARFDTLTTIRDDLARLFRPRSGPQPKTAPVALAGWEARPLASGR